MSSKRIYYEVPRGFLINNLLQNKKTENDRYILEELTNKSLKKILNYCYAYTSGNCWGTEDCYYCTMILFINEEKRRRMGFFGLCEILDRGKKPVNFPRVRIVLLNGLSTIYHDM